jgi:thioredoxin reductase (NADPH)
MAHYHCILIGGGPAGLTAGLYACRGGLSTLLVEKLFVGGQITTTHLLENYPGFPEGVEGMQIGLLMQQQAERFGLKTAYEEVTALDLSADPKEVHLGNTVHTADTVILCMGAQPRLLGLPREEALRGQGVSYCATCDGAFFKGQSVAVVGGGDTAIEDALYLSRMAAKVYVIHRRDTLRASRILQQRLEEADNVEMVWSSRVTAILGEDHVTGVTVEPVAGGEPRDLDIQGLFIAVGTLPQTGLVEGQVALEKGYIVTDEKMRTNLPGVFAAGDIRVTPLRQVVTAASDGAVAATAAVEYCLTHGEKK